MTDTANSFPATPDGRRVRRAPKPEPVEVTWAAGWKYVRNAQATGGKVLRFSGGTIKALPDIRNYLTEVLHQAGTLILLSGLIIWFMEFVVGYECGLEAVYTLKQIGAPLYAGAFNAWCALREMAPYMWGYIAAAKIGCGLVAELGSMRISDEIDAMEVMGVNSRSYLVGTRIVAAWLATPLLYIVGLGSMYLGEYLTSVVLLGGVSSGGYNYSFWLYQNAQDLLFSSDKSHSYGHGDNFHILLLRL